MQYPKVDVMTPWGEVSVQGCGENRLKITPRGGPAPHGPKNVIFTSAFHTSPRTTWEFWLTAIVGQEGILKGHVFPLEFRTIRCTDGTSHPSRRFATSGNDYQKKNLGDTICQCVETMLRQNHQFLADTNEAARREKLASVESRITAAQVELLSLGVQHFCLSQVDTEPQPAAV